MLENAVGLLAVQFAGNDVTFTGECAREVVVGWPIVQKVLLLSIVGSVYLKSLYLMYS